MTDKSGRSNDSKGRHFPVKNPKHPESLKAVSHDADVVRSRAATSAHLQSIMKGAD